MEDLGPCGWMSACRLASMSTHANVTHTMPHFVQIATRLLGAACPPLYWFVALSLFDDEQRQTPGAGETKAVANVKGRLTTCVVAYCAIYNVVGPLLHCNFLPWT